MFFEQCAAPFDAVERFLVHHGRRWSKSIAAVCTVRDITSASWPSSESTRAPNAKRRFELNLAASSALDLDAVLMVLLDRLAHMAPTGAMTVELYRDADKRLARIASRGIDDAAWKSRATDFNTAPHPVVRAKDTVSISDLNVVSNGLDGKFFLDAGLSFYLGFASRQDEVIGVVSIYADRPYGGEELTFPRSFASHAAIVMRSELYEQTIQQTRELEK
jgi:hypothetical protein